MSADRLPLTVKVKGQLAGLLSREAGSYLFNYGPDVEVDQFVSLTMPARQRSYEHPELHPIFEMHLPEGYLLAVIKRHFAKLTSTDSLGLLQLLSHGIKGRIEYGEAQAGTENLSLEDLLHPESPQLFDELVERFALRTALSGVQPKVLAEIENKATLQLEGYIVKAWGDDYPQLALNEYYCMRVLEAAGVEVPKFYLSDDDRLFIMKRFDLDDQGETLGFEDLCVLQGKQRDDKYQGSYEQLAKTIKLFVSPQFKADALEQLFKMLVLNSRLQNGDAHLKNFGVLYEDSQSVRLAPAFDVVSTTAYIREDVSALTLMGSRKWWDKKHLLRFGVQVCDLPPRQAEGLYGECEQALQLVGKDIEEQLKSETRPDKSKLLKHLVGLML